MLNQLDGTSKVPLVLHEHHITTSPPAIAQRERLPFREARATGDHSCAGSTAFGSHPSWTRVYCCRHVQVDADARTRLASLQRSNSKHFGFGRPTNAVQFRLGGILGVLIDRMNDVCVLHMKPFFLPVDILHNQCPCQFFKPRRDTSYQVQYAVTKLRHRDTTLLRTRYAVSTTVKKNKKCSKHYSGQCKAMSSYYYGGP